MDGITLSYYTGERVYGTTSLPGRMVRIYENGKDLGTVKRGHNNGYYFQKKHYHTLREVAAAMKGANWNDAKPG
jgi:hypothetical protein